MASRIPPVPQSNTTDKATRERDQQQRDQAAERADKAAAEAKVKGHDPRLQNIEQQDRHANIKQNTTNQGYQQNR